MKYLLLIPAIACTVLACDVTKKGTSPAQNSGSTSNESAKKYATIDKDFLDLSVSPKQNFFQFSNGNWIKDNPVPPSESRWGSFNELEMANNKKLTALLEEAKNSIDEPGTILQILGSYYDSYMNMDKRDEIGIHAIDQDFSAINNLKEKKDIPSLIAQHHDLGIHSLFNFGVRQDLKNVDYHKAYFSQGGIGLPNKEYYSSENKQEILKAYKEHIRSTFELMNISKEDAVKITSSVLTIESQLAESMMARAELRNPENTYNKYSLEDLNKKMLPFDFDEYIKETGIADFDTLIVGQIEFAEKIAKLFDSLSLDDWKNYLKWKVINHYSGHLNEEFVQINFAFYGKVLSGKSILKPINERAIQEITSASIGELLGKLFVSRHFSDAAMNRVNTMVDNLVVVFRDRINKLEWMSSETKTEALGKLNAIGRKLGFPNKWEDFSSLSLKKEDYIGNIRQIEQFDRQNNLEKLNELVDKNDWSMPAHMVNAYYHPLLNEIAFPAGIMQAPFFSNEYEDAMNYGRIGMVIGHEFTHGFDDMGSKFAADGTFNNWWTEEDKNSFKERTSLLGKTFEAFCPIEGHCVNPELTMGENIADLGGLTLAYYAYTKTDEFLSGQIREGYTPAQRFFIAYAQLWKINYTEEELKNRIANDSHSPGMFRVNGPLKNCPEFFQAFDLKESDAMRNSKEQLSKIW